MRKRSWDKIYAIDEPNTGGVAAIVAPAQPLHLNFTVALVKFAPLLGVPPEPVHVV